MNHGHTLAVAKFLRATRPAEHRRRGGRPVRQQQPDAIRLEYARALVDTTQPMRKAAHAHDAEIVRLCAQARRSDRRDATDDDRARAGQAKQLVERAARAAVDAMNPKRVVADAEKYGARTSAFQYAQLDKQVRQQIGVPLSIVERPARDLIPQFAAENVQLVKTLPERDSGRIAALVDDAFSTGMHPETLARALVDAEDASEWDATRIARDQIGKLNAQLNQVRQEALGVEAYFWRTMRDERVRDEHDALEGQRFTWNEPPAEGNPGEPVMCRCFADPDFSALIERL